MPNADEKLKALQWVKDNSELIFDSPACGYLFTLVDGSIVRANQTLSNWTGFSKTELTSGKKLRDLLTGGGKIYFETSCGPLLRMQGFLNEVSLEIKNQDGSLTPVLLNSEALKNEGGELFLFRHTLFNISDRQKYERELLVERRKSDEAVELLREEKQLREKFVATLTHDLRSPITAAKMSAQMVLRKPDDAAYVQSLVMRILSSAERLDTMIQDLLDANSIRAGEKITLKMELADLPLIVKSAIEDLVTVHGERFTYEGPQTLNGYWNPSGLQRIIENLCNNAIKYGSTQHPIEIKIQSQQDRVVLSVHNFGNPIPKHELTTLFDLYKRSETATSGSQKGWGLGLALVKGVASAHAGEVLAESSQENGTTFSVVLLIDSRGNHPR